MTLKNLKNGNGRRRRLWSLSGHSGDGKSTFATQMRESLLIVDADNRFGEVAHLAPGDVFTLPHPLDNIEIDRIASGLHSHVPELSPGTIVVDSLTEIVVPLTAEATWTNEADRNKNKAAAFVQKAITMRWLQSVVTRWGTDVLWIHHLHEGRDHQARRVVRTTVPGSELTRLQRCLNARLRMVREGTKRGIYVEWSRGNDGMTLWDETDCWEGMPEKLDAALYDGLTAADIHQKQLPGRFGGPEEAIAWAVEYGAFTDKDAAQAAYNELKEQNKPETANAMWELWVPAVVEQRVQLTGTVAEY